jgi:hypothetical protein
LIVAFIMSGCVYIGGRLDEGEFRLDLDEWIRKTADRLNSDRWKWFR